jgi:endonuclease/exonuclease/phosphatase family metal-dependent hydrolase
MRIRIATLNAWALPEPIGVDIPVRMEAIGARLLDLDLDVMAFQEVWTADARRALLAAGRKAGLTNAWHRKGLLRGSGLMVLSRLPIDDIRFEHFSVRGVPEHPRHADFFGGKGFVRLRLQTQEGPVTFFDTHLHARYRSDVAHEYRAHRTGQVVQLAAATLTTRDPVLAVGDFNFEEGQPEYTVLTGLTGMRDIAAALDRREPTIFSGNPYRAGRRKPGRRIDFVFARDGVGRSLIGRNIQRVFDEPFELDRHSITYSDHAGVLAELEIAPQPGTSVATPTRRLASAGLRAPAMSRRRMLRASLKGAALLSLTPGVGMSMLSEALVPSEIRAFEALAAHLEQVDPGAFEKTIA